MDFLQVTPNTVFEWSAGRRLRARSRTQVMLPGGILRDGEELDSLIEVSNDEVCVSLIESESGRDFDFITIDIAAGDSMKLNRSTEVVFLSNLASLVELDILD